MKKFPVIGLLTLACICQARNSPPVITSYYVNPVSSIHVRFNGMWMGRLTPKDSMNWLYHESPALIVKSFETDPPKFTPTKSDMFDDCVYFNPASQTAERKLKKGFIWSHFFIEAIVDSSSKNNSYLVPSSIRFYLDTSHIDVAVDNKLNCDTFPKSLVEDYLRPFYFRKYEVSNKEYREFLSWVLDSIIRTRLEYFLPDGKLDRKKKYDYHEAMKEFELYVPSEERFYNRNDPDSRRFNYRFSERPTEFDSTVINVFPDTLSWLHDWPHFFNEPMSNMYFWHPAYDEYPVAGVNYWQCLAFLEWKTMQLNNSVKGNYEVTCALPSEVEWDYVTTAQKIAGQIQLVYNNYNGAADDSWLTDLQLWYDTTTRHIIYDAKYFPAPDTLQHMDMIYLAAPKRKIIGMDSYNDQYSKPLRRLSLAHEKTWGDFVYDGAFHTAPVKIGKDGYSVISVGDNGSSRDPKFNERARAHYDEATGICWLDGNVSEWMREDFDKNWRGIFSKHLLVMDGPYAEEEKLIRSCEKYYFDKLPQRGKLVRGCNWYDERFGMRYAKNVAGTQAKTFCNPNEAHCTLGFRYVIYLSEG